MTEVERGICGELSVCVEGVREPVMNNEVCWCVRVVGVWDVFGMGGWW